MYINPLSVDLISINRHIWVYCIRVSGMISSESGIVQENEKMSRLYSFVLTNLSRIKFTQLQRMTISAARRRSPSILAIVLAPAVAADENIRHVGGGDHILS